jgi:hypothetical protein
VAPAFVGLAAFGGLHHRVGLGFRLLHRVEALLHEFVALNAVADAGEVAHRAVHVDVDRLEGLLVHGHARDDDDDDDDDDERSRLFASFKNSPVN